ncbi:MAG: T6SS immunity protein Tdi1 domain-containing protein [Parvularculaceae bacterium]
MESLIAIIERAWGWAGIAPKVVLERNAFGNLLVLDQLGQYWRICPEDLSCAVIAKSEEDCLALRASADFQIDWNMVRLREIAESSVGKISHDRAYCLKIPSVLGGAYERENLGEMSVAELISLSGDLAHQISELPDGDTVRLQLSE